MIENQQYTTFQQASDQEEHLAEEEDDVNAMRNLKSSQTNDASLGSLTAVVEAI